MKHLLVVGLLCFMAFVSLPPNIPEQPKSNSPNKGSSGLTDPKEFEAWVDQFFADNGIDVAAVSVGFVLAKKDKILFQKGYGYADDQKKTTVNPEQTLFRAASVSKLVTATAVMQLVESRKLDLSADVNTYLKGFQVKGDYSAPVTAANLMTHTSGIEDSFIGNSVPIASEIIPLGEYFARRPPRRIRPPGQQIIYSNRGMALAGHLVESASGTPFYEFVEHNIFQPLGMEHSSFRQPYPPQLAPYVVPSGAEGDALLLYPSGSLISTVADMGRFIVAHLNGGRLGDRRILSDASVREMHRQHFTQHSQMPGVAYGFFENLTNGRRVLFHTGLSGHQSILCLLPDESVGFYLVYSGPQRRQRELRERFLQAFVDHYFPMPGKSDSSGSQAEPGPNVERYAGYYRPNLLPTTTIEKIGYLAADTSVVSNGDGTLTVGLPPLATKRLRIEEVEPLLFKSEDGFYFAFAEDESGNIAHMFMSGSIQDPVGFDKLHWYERGLLHAGFMTAGYFTFLSFCIVSLLAFFLHLWRKRSLNKGASPEGSRLAWRLAILVSVLYVLSPILFFVWYMLGEAETRPYRVESALYLSLSVLLVAAVLGLTLPLFALMLWKRRDWSLPWRIYYSVVAATALLMVPLSYYWNLLGFRV